MPQSRTCSTSNTTSFPATRSALSEAKRFRIGGRQLRPELERALRLLVRPAPSSRDNPRRRPAVRNSRRHRCQRLLSLYMTSNGLRVFSRKALAPDGLRIQAPAPLRAQRVLRWGEIRRSPENIDNRESPKGQGAKATGLSEGHPRMAYHECHLWRRKDDWSSCGLRASRPAACPPNCEVHRRHPEGPLCRDPHRLRLAYQAALS
jgi:hypothetical protein